MSYLASGGRIHRSNAHQPSLIGANDLPKNGSVRTHVLDRFSLSFRELRAAAVPTSADSSHRRIGNCRTACSQGQHSLHTCPRLNLKRITTEVRAARFEAEQEKNARLPPMRS